MRNMSLLAIIITTFFQVVIAVLIRSFTGTIFLLARLMQSSLRVTKCGITLFWFSCAIWNTTGKLMF